MSGMIDYLIVGLGNPGSRYERTRHNIGWIALDNFRSMHNAKEMTLSGDSLYQKINIAGKNIVIAKPMTFMNNSGEAVAQLMKKFSVDIERIIVLVDEYNLAVGKVHLKNQGSHSGHNGIKSLMYHLSSNKFYRLRLGIGNNFASGEMTEYVLSNFTCSEKEEVEIMARRASEALNSIISKGTATSMTLINSERLYRTDETKIKPE